MTAHPTPGEAWARLRQGNHRFVADTMEHPDQSAARRTEVSVDQTPFAVVLGCSDSRVAAELVFDQGLGDLFVVRTAGHVLDTTVIGSIEYGVGILGIPLIVVLGHDSCGAVGAAVKALTTGRMPTGFVRAVVDRVIPSLVTRAVLPGETPDGEAAPAGAEGTPTDDDSRLTLPPAGDLRRQHVRSTVEMLVDYSAMVRQSIAAGETAVVGVEYTLAEGTAMLVDVVGDVGEAPLATGAAAG
ncbi:carbonic anhydrase [Georgenia sp. Z1491]|uniref:carbonic anhydrase n=1 Tax=Georgenia sp. Z1491 TaxID=3416707 RepID=UPI003CE9CE9A